MAYTSEIKLEIAEVPKTDDAEQLPDLIDIYNSIHILTQWVNEIIKARQDDNSPDQDPDKLKPFKKSLDALVGEDVKAGNIVYPTRDNDIDAWVLGAPRYDPNAQFPINLHGRVAIAVVLEDATAYTKTPVAIGPGILKVTGSVLGQEYFLSNNIITRGFLNSDPGGSAPPIPVGHGLGDEYVLVYESLVW